MDLSHHNIARNSTNGAGRLAGRRILVVEDEIIIAMALQAGLEDDEAEVVGPSHTLAAALDLAAHADVSAAILDLCLGPESIAPVARLLNERGIPFLFYTGQSESDPVRREWPRVLSLPKPTPTRQIVQAVASLFVH